MSDDSGPGLRVWTRARDGGPDAHNEDAMRIDDGWAAGRPSVFVAIADGVSAAPFSGEWARAVVEAATPRWLDGELTARIEEVRRRFDPLASAATQVDFVLEDLWRERGSAATLLLVEIAGSADGSSIRAAAVGDSIVLVSNQHAVTSFPLASADEFTSRPETVSTRRREIVVQRWAMDLAPGSHVAMASDGIGAWMLGLAERAGAVSLYEWLRDVDDGALPEIDDDLTLVLISLPDRLATSRRRRLERWLGLVTSAAGRRQ